MAETILDYKFSYENGATFKLQQQHGTDGWETVIEIDENTHISEIWDSIKSICMKTFELEVDTIGNVMKAE